jgi:hypothetical protein
MKQDRQPKRTARGGRGRHADDTMTVAVFGGAKPARPKTLGDRLGELFLEWAWATRHRDWERAVRTLARTLKGCEGAGLIERQRLRGEGGETLHLVRLTPLGKVALALLSGDDSEAES